MKKINLFLSLALFFVLLSCGKKDVQSLEVIASSYFSSQKDVIGFGKISVNQIVEQSKIQDIPLVGGMVKSELDGIKSSLDIQESIFFGVSAKDKNDYTVTALAKVKNLDSLTHYIKERGYTIESKNNINIAEEEELLFIFDKDLIVLKAGNTADKTSILKNFASIKSGEAESNPYVQEALAQKVPITFSLFPDKFYDLNSTDELKNVIRNDLYKGILQTIDIQFNKGSIEITNTFNGDKKQVDKLDFIHPSDEAKKLKISGNDILTLALNVDFARIEKENKNLFSFLTKKLNEELSGEASSTKNELLATVRKFISKDKPLTSVSNGVFYVTADANKLDYKKPQIKFYLGSTNQELKEYLKTLLLTWDKAAQITLTNNAIEGNIYKATDINYSQNSGAHDHVFKLFIDMNYLASIFEVTDPNTAMYLKPLKNVDIFSKGNKTTLLIHTMDANTNALEYLVKQYANNLIAG